MSEVDDFLSATMPRLVEADTALHSGDAGPRSAMWSRNEPVTLFGAAATKTGWAEVQSVFDWLASSFTRCESFDYEVIAAGASGDLAYVAGIEHTTASVDGRAPVPYQLRVTTIFRREGGEWKVVHRHGDPVPGGETAGPGMGLFDQEAADS